MLEQHWNGTTLDTLQVALNDIETMPWRGLHPVVRVVTKLYQNGLFLTKAAMAALEQRFVRDPTLGKWFVTIRPQGGAG